MKKFKLSCILIGVVILTMVLAACAKSSKEDSSYSNLAAYDMDAPAEPAMGYSEEQKADYGNGGDNGSGLSFTSAYLTASGENTAAMSMEKIIRNIRMELETREFDELIETIGSEITRLGGYVESSSIRGKRYNSEALRRGSIVARIPKDKLDEFVDIVNENSNVVDESENTENVTLQYFDIESHKKALEIEQERLFELLEKSDTMEEIITLESRLSSIRYEIGSYETQLRTYDNKVDYSTVSMEIEEVERMSPAVEEKITVFGRIKAGFSDTVYNLGEGLKNFFVWFVVNLPYILIWAVIIAVVTIVIRKSLTKRNRKGHPIQEQGKKDTGKDEGIKQ